MSKIMIMSSMLIGFEFLPLNAMDFDDKLQKKSYGTFENHRNDHSSESVGCFSLFCSFFNQSETTKVKIPAAVTSVCPQQEFEEFSHADLIATLRYDPRAGDMLIERLYKGLIPSHLVRTVDFNTLLKARIFDRSGNFLKSNRISYKVTVILITYISSEKWPQSLISHIQERSLAGSHEADYLLGYLYLNGKQFPKDLNIALEFFKRAADRGEANAQNYLGYMYFEGIGVERDFYWAGYYYRQAVEQGHAQAQNNLACLYEIGRGVGQDYDKARALFEKASAQGYEDAQLGLLHLYETEKIDGIDVYDVLERYRILADQGNVRAQYRLGLLYKYEGGNDQQTVVKNPDLACEYLRLAADQGHKNAQLEELEGDSDVKNELIDLRLRTAHGGNISSRQFFQRMCVNTSPLSSEKSQDYADRINLFIKKMELLDATYIAIGAMAEEGNDFSVENGKGGSFKELFPFFPNADLKEKILGLSKLMADLTVNLRQFHEVGFLITCLDMDNKIFEFSKVSKGDATYLCLNTYVFSEPSFDLYEAELKETSFFYVSICAIMKDIKNMDFNENNIKSVFRLLGRSDENLPLLNYMAFYFKYFPTDKYPQKQKLFIEGLDAYFLEVKAKFKGDLSIIPEMNKELDSLIIETTPYRNDVFLKYIGVIDSGDLEGGSSPEVR